MDQMTHEVPGQAADPHAGHKMPMAQGNHDRHVGHSVAMFRDKFWLSFALTIPVVFWSMDVQRWLGYTAPSFPGSKFLPAILGTVVFGYGGLVFIRGAWGELADHKPGMMTLISLAIVVAFGTSLAATFGLFEIEVWWELASLITIMVLAPLARNASHFPGPRGTQCARRASPRHCRTCKRNRDSDRSNI